MAEEGQERHPNDPYPNPVTYHEKVLRVWRLAENGMRQVDIAKEVGCAQSTVSKYLKEARTLFTPVDTETERALWLGRWDKLYAMTMAELEVSGDAVKLLPILRQLLRDRAWFTGTNAAKKFEFSYAAEDEIDKELQDLVNSAKAKNALRKQERNGDGSGPLGSE